MNSRSGLSFLDVLIILAIVLLLAALAVPRFVKVPDFGNEEDIETTDQNLSGIAPTNKPAAEVTGQNP
jgi:hypothetical protein